VFAGETLLAAKLLVLRNEQLVLEVRHLEHVQIKRLDYLDCMDGPFIVVAVFQRIKETSPAKDRENLRLKCFQLTHLKTSRFDPHEFHAD